MREAGVVKVGGANACHDVPEDRGCHEGVWC